MTELDNDSEFWVKVLKNKCNDCYELNRYREVRNSVSGEIFDGMMLDIRYCPKHEQQLENLRRVTKK